MSETKMKDAAYRSPDERQAEKNSKYTPKSIFLNGVLYENPALRLVLGTCPLLAVTISAKSSLYMGLAVLFVLTASEAIISLLRNVIPNKVRIPAFITIIATFVTIVQMLISAYFPALNDSLGIYIPLIVVNCILLARAETFASKQKVLPSILDGRSMGTGFTLALLMMGSIREILGCGTFFDMKLPLFGDVIEPMMFFMLPPGGFFVFGICICIVQAVMKKQEKHASSKSSTPCGVAGDKSDCLSCGGCSLCKGKEE